MKKENLGSPNNETPKEKRAVKPSTVGGIFTSYEVKSKGYQETFTNVDEANRQADILKKRGIKNGEGVNIKILANRQDDEKQITLKTIKIDEGFYSN